MMRKLLIGLLLIAISCSSDDVSPIEFTVITKGELPISDYLNKREYQIIIRDIAAWNELLDQLATNRYTLEDFERSIDFERETIVAIFDEIRPLIGYSIDVRQVVELPEELVVTYMPISTEEGYTALSRPFVIVKLPVTGKRVSFKKEVDSR